MLHILLTFDYELFFSNCAHSEKTILYDTTSRIQETLLENDVPGTFFVDTPSVIRYEEFNLQEYPEMVNKQVNDLLDSGMDIQLHIHPIWFRAEYNNDEGWSFNQKYYSLNSFRNVTELISRSKNKLDQLANINHNYKCCAFRAGGFCLTPEREVLLQLRKEGIWIDSSVCSGIKMEAVGQSYDWTRAKEVQQWMFDYTKGVLEKTEEKDMMYEIPVGTYSKVPQKWFYTHCHPKLNYPPLKGKPSPVIPLVRQSKIKKFFDRIHASLTTPILFSTDSLHANALYEIVKYLEKNHKGDVYICSIGHPKFSSDECMNNMGLFLKKVKKGCPNVDFITMRDACEQLQKINTNIYKQRRT